VQERTLRSGPSCGHETKYQEDSCPNNDKFMDPASKMEQSIYGDKDAEKAERPQSQFSSPAIVLDKVRIDTTV